MSEHRKAHAEFEPSSGDVFADLGFDRPAQETTRAELMLQIVRIVRERGLRQHEVASVLGIPQPKVSLLVRGRTAGFSTDRLLRFLNRLDQDVRIVVTAKASARGRARVAVVRGESAPRATKAPRGGRARDSSSDWQPITAAPNRRKVASRVKYADRGGRRSAAKRK